MPTKDDEARCQHRRKTRVAESIHNAVAHWGDCSAKQSTKLYTEKTLTGYLQNNIYETVKMIWFVQGMLNDNRKFDY